MNHIVKSDLIVSIKHHPTENDECLVSMNSNASTLMDFKQFFRYIKQVCGEITSVDIHKVMSRPSMNINSLADAASAPIKERKYFYALDVKPEFKEKPLPILGLDEDHQSFAARYAKVNTQNKIDLADETKRIKDRVMMILMNELNGIMKESGKDRINWNDFIDIPENQRDHLMGELMNNIITDFHPDNIKNKQFRTHVISMWHGVQRVKENDMDKVRSSVTITGNVSVPNDILTPLKFKNMLEASVMFYAKVKSSYSGSFDNVRLTPESLRKVVDEKRFIEFITAEEYLQSAKFSDIYRVNM